MAYSMARRKSPETHVCSQNISVQNLLKLTERAQEDLPVVKDIFIFYWVWGPGPGTGLNRSGAQFYAICPYRCVRSSHMEPIQAQNHDPVNNSEFFIFVLNCRWEEKIPGTPKLRCM